jgi:hypothetical protein
MTTMPQTISLTALLLSAGLAVPALAQTAQPVQSQPDTQTISPSRTAPPVTPPSPTADTPTPKPEEPKPTENKRGFQIPKIGIDYDIFLPSSGKTRDRFGKSWGGIGIGVGRPDRPSSAGRISFDFSTEYKNSGDNHAFLAPIGVSYRRAFNPDDLTHSNTFIPYYGISADLVVVDLHSVEDDVHSRFRLSEGGSVLVGTTIGASGFVEGKYTAIAKVQGFDLSGIRLAVGIRF